jgi:hypothetical protein
MQGRKCCLLHTAYKRMQIQKHCLLQTFNLEEGAPVVWLRLMPCSFNRHRQLTCVTQVLSDKMHHRVDSCAGPGLCSPELVARPQLKLGSPDPVDNPACKVIRYVHGMNPWRLPDNHRDSGAVWLT